MEPLPGVQLLALWDSGGVRTPAARALALLSAAEVADAAHLPVGLRDALLLDVQAAAAGPELDAVANCPACHRLLDVPVDLAVLGSAGVSVRERGSVVESGHTVDFRVPTSADLAALAPASDPAAGAAELLDACVLAARRDDGTPVPAGELPDVVIAAVERAMARADPRAETILAVQCPDCALEWTVVIDAAALAWSQIVCGARQLAGEVSVLASRHGWSERDILALTPARRRLYLELLAG